MPAVRWIYGGRSRYVGRVQASNQFLAELKYGVGFFQLFKGFLPEQWVSNKQVCFHIVRCLLVLRPNTALNQLPLVCED